jgi:hypothetical protein
MVFPPARLIAYITQVMTLEPGDVILTGTPEGVGRLAAGDRIEVEVEGVGVLRNTVRYGRGGSAADARARVRDHHATSGSARRGLGLARSARGW